MTISASSYLNAALAARELSNKGICVTVSPASVLGELLDLSTSFIAPKTTDMAMILSNPGVQSNNFSNDANARANYVASMTGDFCEQSQHSLKIAAIAEDLAPYVLSHISFARNTVTPMVVELAARLEKYAESAKPLDPISQFEIIEGVVPALVLDESFISGGLENYNGVEAKVPNSGFSMAVPAEPEYYAGLVQLGSDRLNELVADWLRGLPADFIKNVFAANFAGVSAGPSGVDYYIGMSDRFRGPYERLNIALACYILGNRLYNDVQPTGGNLSLSQYKSMMREFIDYAGVELNKAVSLIKRQIESGTLVTEAVLSQKRITVHQVIYRSWLQAGGKPEVLLGMLTGGQVLYGVASIEENREKLTRQWQAYVTLVQADIKAETMKRFREYLSWEMSNSLSTLSDDEIEYGANHVDMKKRIMDNVNTQIEHLGHRLMDDFYHTALHLVAKARFYYTSSYEILHEMVQVSKENPEIDPREAVLLSTITYFASYFTSQMKTQG